MAKVAQPVSSSADAFHRGMVDASLHAGHPPITLGTKNMSKECMQTVRCVCDIAVCLFSLPLVLLYSCSSSCCRREKDRKIDKL